MSGRKGNPRQNETARQNREYSLPIVQERAVSDRLRPTTKSGEMPMAYPNLKQSIWLIVLFAFSQLILAALADILGMWQPEDGFLSGIASLVGFVVILVYVYRRTDLDWEYLRQLFNTGFNWRVWPSAVMTTVGLLMVDIGLILAMERLIPGSMLMQESTSAEVGHNTPFWSALMAVVVIGPLVEEMLFRGIILNGLAARYTRIRAIVWSAVLFGVYHMEALKLAPAFLSGLVWGWWSVRTGSLLPALFGHVLINSMSVAGRYSTSSEGAVPENSGDITSEAWIIFVAGAGLAGLGLWWFYRISKETQHISEDQEPQVKPRLDAV